MGCLPDEMVLEGSLLSALHRLELGRSKIGREVVVVQAHDAAQQPTDCRYRLHLKFGV